MQPVAGRVLICRNVLLRSLFKSSLNTSYHPHPFPLFLGALKCFVRHGKKENETCTALLLEEVLPLTPRPWFQLFLTLARLGFKKKKIEKKIPKSNKKKLEKNPQQMKHSKVASRDTAHLEWQLRREADKCSAVQNPWRKTRWKCKIKTCMKSLPEAEFRSATPQDWATHKISHGHPTSTGAHRVKARSQHQDQHYFLGFFLTEKNQCLQGRCTEFFFISGIFLLTEAALGTSSGHVFHPPLNFITSWS